MTVDDTLAPEARRELEAIDAALAGEPVPADLTELGALALALRTERPAASARFATELDDRAAAGFPRRRRLAALRARLAAVPSLLVPAAVAATLAIGVTAAVIGLDTGQAPVGAGGATSAQDGAGSAAPDAGVAQESAAPDGRELSGDEDAAAGARSAPSLAPFAPVPPLGGSPRSDGRTRRVVEHSAAVVLAAPPSRVDDAARRIVAVADRLRGFVLTSSVTAAGDPGTSGGEFVLRVPTARLPEALAQLSRIGDVRERRQTTNDITREGVSARDRLAEARAERSSLLRRLAAARTDEETIRLRRRLRSVDRRISAARQAVASVANRGRYATVAVSLLGDARSGDHEDDAGVWGPGDAARDALRVLQVAAGVLLIALAVALPLGLLVLLGVPIARAAARRGRERALDAV